MLADETQWIITGSAVRCATKTSPNLRMNPLEGEDQPQDLTSGVIVYGWPHPDGSEDPPHRSTITFDDLLGRLFLLPIDKNGEKKRATISNHAHTLDQAQVSREDQLRFNLKVDRDQLDDLIYTTNSWSTWRTPWILGNLKMDSTNSSLSKTTEVYTLLLTRIPWK